MLPIMLTIILLLATGSVGAEHTFLTRIAPPPDGKGCELRDSLHDYWALEHGPDYRERFSYVWKYPPSDGFACEKLRKDAGALGCHGSHARKGFKEMRFRSTIRQGGQTETERLEYIQAAKVYHKRLMTAVAHLQKVRQQLESLQCNFSREGFDRSLSVPPLQFSNQVTGPEYRMTD